MGIQQEHGKWGEEKAAAFLKGEGFEILARNWRYKRAEIDIVAKESGVLVFVEVKTRASTSFGRPEEMVDRRKRRLLIDAAMAYMRSIGYEWEIRFDILAIIGEPGGACDIRLYRDAFFPGLNYG
ncbi:MAG: YraN family protein [Saprospiraceae bacterium]|nr:YraN family protein [Saprospiraceae bacterium]